MDFRRPLQVLTPTLDGDVLATLARTTEELTGGELHRMVGHSSEEGIRRAAERLAGQGIVRRRTAGQAHLYRLNREHVAATYVEGLATLREQLIERLRETIRGWSVRPTVAVLFGSVVSGEAGPESDLDLLVVRPSGCEPDTDPWQAQMAGLEDLATAWTGNDARVLEYGEDELPTLGDEPVIREALQMGIEIGGSIRSLRRRLSGERAT